RTFRKWTERAFGPAQSDELLMVHRAILEEIERKIQTIQRGRRIFPYNYLRVRLVSPEADKRALFQAAFAQERRLENDIREALAGAGCTLSTGFSMDVETAEEGDRGFHIDSEIRESAPAAEVPPEPEPKAQPVTEPPPTAEFVPARLVVVRGKA